VETFYFICFQDPSQNPATQGFRFQQLGKMEKLFVP